MKIKVNKIKADVGDTTYYISVDSEGINIVSTFGDVHFPLQDWEELKEAVDTLLKGTLEYTPPFFGGIMSI